MRTRDIIREAKKDGASRGRTAASWVFDGNTKIESYRWMLKGIEEGDPEVLDSLRPPNLSGEWADEPTPRWLQDFYEVDDDRWQTIVDDVCDAWTAAADEAFWHEIERTCRFQLEKETNH